MSESFVARFKTPDPDPTPPPPGSGSAPHQGFDNAVIEVELGKVRAAPEGIRNKTLNDAAFNLGQLYPTDTVLWPLLEAASQCGLGRFEAERTIRSGFAGAARNPRPAHRMPRTDKIARPLEDLPSIDGYQAPENPLLDWDELWADPGTLEWLCEPVIPAGRLVALYSPPGVGKSLLALDLAVNISQGHQAMGTDTKPVPVLYLDYENTPLDIRDRLQNMRKGPSDLTGLHYWSFPTLPPLDTPQGGVELLGMVKDLGAQLVIIDTVSRAVQGDENENATWLALYRCTLQHIKAAGVAVMRLDHTGKDETKGQRGGSAKSGDVDLVWRMEEIVKDNSYILECEKHRIQLDETRLLIRRSSTPLGHHVDTRAIPEVKKDAILMALDDAGLPPEAGRDRARRVLDAAGIRVRNETLADILRQRQHPYGQLEQ